MGRVGDSRFAAWAVDDDGRVRTGGVLGGNRMRHRLPVSLVCIGVLTGLVAGAGAARASETPHRAAVDLPASHSPAISADGRFIAFVSDVNDLLGGEPTADPNGAKDVFRVDTLTGTVRLISADHATGAPANGASTAVDISADGRYVAFTSEASNLVPADLNGHSDVFRYDAVADGIELVSRKGLTGAQGNGVSDVPTISRDGDLVAFTSESTNLVGNDSNNRSDVFVRDMSAGSTTRVSTDSNGKQSNGDSFQAAISPNGSVVAFSTTATNLSKVDSSRTNDVYVKVLASGKTSIVSVRTDGVRGSTDSFLEDVSNSGRFVALQSYSALVKNDTNNAGDVFLRDRTAGTTIRVSKDGSTQANDQSFGAAISDDGAWIVFQTWATNLVPGPDGNGSLTDVLEFEVATGDLTRISRDMEGGWPEAASYDTALSGNGLRTCFASAAADLVAGDTNGVDDVVCRTWGDASRTSAITERWSVPLPLG